MPLDKETKDEIRELIQDEIYKAFEASFSAAQDYSPFDMIGSLIDPSKRARNTENSNLINGVGNAVKSVLQDLRAEAQATVMEKTDPAAADRIRRIKPEF